MIKRRSNNNGHDDDDSGGMIAHLENSNDLPNRTEFAEK